MKTYVSISVMAALVVFFTVLPQDGYAQTRKRENTNYVKAGGSADMGNARYLEVGLGRMFSPQNSEWTITGFYYRQEYDLFHSDNFSICLTYNRVLGKILSGLYFSLGGGPYFQYTKGTTIIQTYDEDNFFGILLNVGELEYFFPQQWQGSVFVRFNQRFHFSQQFDFERKVESRDSSYNFVVGIKYYFR